MDDQRQRLVPLSEARDLRVSRDLPDVRGWRVVGSDLAPLGRVHDLLVDTEAGRARYLAVEVPGDGGEPRRVHVPIGLARIDAAQGVVAVPTLTTAALLELTTVEGDVVTREYEVRVRRGIVGAEEFDADDDARFYEHEHYDERRFAAPARDAAGRARRAEDVDDERDAEDDEEEDFSYLVGVGGAMTERDEHPSMVGEVDAGQISIPVMEEETDGPVAPEDGDEERGGGPR